MKARFLALVALLFGMAACQTEPEGLDVNMDGTTTISVVLPEDAITRAAADETNSAWSGLQNVKDETLRVIFQVYDENGVTKDGLRQTATLEEGEYVANFDVRLVPNRKYTFVAWADQGEEYFDVTDLKNVQILSWEAMDECRDAFTATETVENYTSASNITLKLIRPFAKLRVVTTDMAELGLLNITPAEAEVEYGVELPNAFNAYAGEAGTTTTNKTFANFDIAKYNQDAANTKTLFTDYILVPADGVVKFSLKTMQDGGREIKSNNFNTDIPVKRNNLTTIAGNVLTDGNNIKVEVKPEFGGKTDYNTDENTLTETVDTAAEFAAAFADEDTDIIVLDGDINLDELVTHSAADKVWTIAKDKELTLDLNGYTLSATSVEKGKNFYMFNSYGTLNVKNGTILYQHNGDNMEWNNCTSIFYAGANGTLNLDGVIAKNLGGSDMAYVVDMTNAQNINVNIENSTLESTYIAVRVFNNSKTGVNNVDIKNTTLSGKYCFWVQYWLADGRDEATLEQTLNINIYNQGNTFEYTGASAVIYGFNETVYANEDGITKKVKVSEDGTEVTLGSIVENGLIRRGVAGAEENSTIKKVVIEEGVGVLYDRTFRRFYALEEVVLPSTLTTIGAAGSGVFQSCTSLKSIVIPESVTVLGKGSFQECSSLESINIPSGVTRIEENALRATGLVSVEFHEGVTYFGAQAFRDCKQLKKVYIYAPEFTIEANAFGVMSGTLPGTTIYVANAEMKAYLESTLAYKNQLTIVAPAEDKNALKTELLEAIKNGETNIVIDAMGSNIGDLNYGLTTTMVPEGTTVTIRNAAIEGKSYGNGVNGTIIFEGCTFNNSGAYSIHFDNGNGNVIFKNCHLYGWNSFGASLTSVSFEDCTLTGNGTYALIRSYADLTLTNCVINTSNANHNDGYSEGVEAIAPATLTENNVTYVIESDNALANALAEGKDVTLSQDVTTEAATTAPYGNKYAFKQDGGVIDGNGHELYMECYGDDYGIMTSGGTIKNLTITEGCRAVMIMYPQQDVILDNVKIGGDGVLYPINTGEAGADDVDLIVTNSELAGWTSYGLIKSATFTNVEFKQGTYYNNIYGRVLKPYVNTTLTNCTFVEHMNLDLSSLNNGHKIVMKNCKVNGVAVTAEVFTIPTTNAQYDTELFTIDLPSWASSINDCVVFE